MHVMGDRHRAADDMLDARQRLPVRPGARPTVELQERGPSSRPTPRIGAAGSGMRARIASHMLVEAVRQSRLGDDAVDLERASCARPSTPAPTMPSRSSPSERQPDKDAGERLDLELEAPRTLR